MNRTILILLELQPCCWNEANLRALEFRGIVVVFLCFLLSNFFSALFLDLLLFRCWISWLDPLAFSFLFSTSLPFLLDSLEDFLQFYLHNLCTNFFYYFCHIFNLQELGTFSFYSFLGRFWVILEGGYLSEKVDI